MALSAVRGAASLAVLVLHGGATLADTPRCEIDFGMILGHRDGTTSEVHEGPIGPSTHFGSHGQLLFGEEAVYLYHLPFLLDDPGRHPHNFQVLMRVSFVDAADEQVYLERRKQMPEALFTALPGPFDQDRLEEIFVEGATGRALGPVELFDEHFENRPRPEPFVTAEMVIDEVVQFSELLPAGETAEELRYLIVEGEEEAFLVHELSAPPDFDQVLTISLAHDASAVANPSLNGGVLRMVDAANTEHGRLAVGQTMSCAAHDGTRRPIQDVIVAIEREVYCEAGELSAVANSPAFEGKRACADG
jgi:hypothetical protein